MNDLDIWAFPSHGSMGEVVQEGMTLRDYLAARASEEDIQRHLTGMVKVIVGQNEKGPIYEYQQAFRSREQARYRWADAMLAARSAT